MVEPIDIRTGKPFTSRRQHLHHPPSDGASLGGGLGRARGLMGGAFMGTLMAQQAHGPTPWVNPYVTDGLAIFWDGEWNVAGGQHDSSATSIADLTGNTTAKSLPSGWYFGDNYLTHTSGGKFVLSRNASQLSQIVDNGGWTMEIVVDQRTASQSAYMGVDCNIGAYANKMARLGIGNRFQGSGVTSQVTKYIATTDVAFSLSHYAVSCALNGPTVVYHNGLPVSTFSDVGGINGNQYGYGYYSLLSSSASSTAVSGIVYSARFYHTALTAQQIAANYTQDHRRFWAS